MNREDRERLVDGALARALAPKVEPREGFEERLLANLAAQPERRPWWRWMWVPAVVALAVVAIVLGARVLRHPAPAPTVSSVRYETPQVPVRSEQARNTHVTGPVRVAKQHRRQREVVVVAQATEVALPRMSVFPAPAPLTEQERLLLALSNRHRGEVEVNALDQMAARERAEKFAQTGLAPEMAPFTATNFR